MKRSYPNLANPLNRPITMMPSIDPEPPEGARSLGVGLAIGHVFATELRQLLDEVMVVQQDRSVRPGGQRVLVALDRDAGIGRRRLVSVMASPSIVVKQSANPMN
jgi:hypothetical protein